MNVNTIWKNCLSFIKDNISEDAFNVWFSPIEPVEIRPDNTLVIMVPSRFFVEWIEDHYLSLIHCALKMQLNATPKLAYKYKLENSPSKTEQATIQEPSQNRKVANIEKKNETYNPYAVPGIIDVKIDSRLNPNKNFDSLVEGDSNRTAILAGMRVGTKPGESAFNPLFIYGNVGLGKTHLANAIGLEIQYKFPKKRILYVEAEDFVSQYTDAVKANTRNSFTHFYQQVDVLIMDNIQFFCSKFGSQDAFFNIFNSLHQSGKQIIMTSDRSPANIQDINDRLLSRFKWGLSVELQAPDSEMRRKILKNILYRDGIVMSDDIVNYIVRNVRTNIRELEGVTNSIMVESLFNRKEITMELAEKVIRRIVSDVAPAITIDYIEELVTKRLGVPLEDIYSISRKRNIVQGRHLIMFLSYKYANLALATIGKRIGKRDHSTVIHACKTMRNQYDTDKNFRKIVDELVQIISD